MQDNNIKILFGVVFVILPVSFFAYWWGFNSNNSNNLSRTDIAQQSNITQHETNRREQSARSRTNILPEVVRTSSAPFDAIEDLLNKGVWDMACHDYMELPIRDRIDGLSRIIVPFSDYSIYDELCSAYIEKWPLITRGARYSVPSMELWEHLRNIAGRVEMLDYFFEHISDNDVNNIALLDNLRSEMSVFAQQNVRFSDEHIPSIVVGETTIEQVKQKIYANRDVQQLYEIHYKKMVAICQNEYRY